MNWLIKAADMGHRPAQAQIQALAGAEGARVEGSWADLARKIDLKGLLRAPSLSKLRESPSIALIEGLATPAMCRWLIHRGGGKLAPAMVGDYTTGQWVRDPIRSGLAAGFGLADTDIALVLTQKRLELASGLALHQQEAPHVLSYEVGQEYKAHFDFLLPDDPAFAHILQAMGQRVATCLTWLNDDYEGGETAFLKIDWTLSRQGWRFAAVPERAHQRPQARSNDIACRNAGDSRPQVAAVAMGARQGSTDRLKPSACDLPSHANMRLAPGKKAEKSRSFRDWGWRPAALLPLASKRTRPSHKI